MPTLTPKPTHPRTTKSDSQRKTEFNQKCLVHVYRESCDVSVTRTGRNEFVWRVQQADDCFGGDDFQDGGLNEEGTSPALKQATQDAFDCLFDHLGID